MTRKAIIEIADNDELHRRAMDTAREISAGRTVKAANFTLGFESSAQVFAELTGERMRTLETLQRSGAQSIYALAKRLGRNYSNVHGDVQRLMVLGLIERNQDDRVHVPFDSVEIHLSFGTRAA